MKGKIIAVVGVPASGKSFLVKKLAQHYKAIAFFEGEEKDLPKRVTENLKKNIRNLETIVWFRNKLAKEIVKAKKLAQKGRNMILDTFWLSNECDVKSMLKGFEKDIVTELSNFDRKILDYPNIVIFLKISGQTINNFVKKGKENLIKEILLLKELLKLINSTKKYLPELVFKTF